MREYWVIHPSERTVLRFVLNEEGKYIGLAPKNEDSPEIDSTVLTGFSVQGVDIFP